MTGHVKPDLGAYVLGALEREEADAVRRHLDACEACAAEHRSLEPLPGLLTVANGAHQATAEPLPAAFEERLLDAAAGVRPLESPRRKGSDPWWALRRRWLAAGVAAAALAAAGALLLAGGEPAPRPAYEVTLHGVGAARDASARASLESLPGGTEVHLWVRDLPTGSPAVYEVLCEAPGWQASAGTFRVDASGDTYVVLTTAARRGEYDAIRVVRRSRGPDGEVVTREVLEARL